MGGSEDGPQGQQGCLAFLHHIWQMSLIHQPLFSEEPRGGLRILLNTFSGQPSNQHILRAAL